MKMCNVVRNDIHHTTVHVSPHVRDDLLEMTMYTVLHGRHSTKFDQRDPLLLQHQTEMRHRRKGEEYKIHRPVHIGADVTGEFELLALDGTISYAPYNGVVVDTLGSSMLFVRVQYEDDMVVWHYTTELQYIMKPNAHPEPSMFPSCSSFPIIDAVSTVRYIPSENSGLFPHFIGIGTFTCRAVQFGCHTLLLPECCLDLKTGYPLIGAMHPSRCIYARCQHRSMCCKNASTGDGTTCECAVSELPYNLRELCDNLLPHHVIR